MLLGGDFMAEAIAKLIQRLRNAGFEVEAVPGSAHWNVSDHGNLTTGEVIDLANRVKKPERQAA